MNDESILILPACIEKCNVPKLLQTKKYAAFHKSYEQGLSEILDALSHYEATKLNADFFHAVEGVRAELASVSEIFSALQHEHWDRFEATIGSLSDPEQRQIQRSNTESYLTKWHLSVTQLKNQLRLLGVYDGDVNDELADDVFDAIIRFQRKHNLRHIDGVFGPLTYSEMGKVARSSLGMFLIQCHSYSGFRKYCHNMLW